MREFSLDIAARPHRRPARRHPRRAAGARAARLARQRRQLPAAGAAPAGIDLVALDLPGHGRSAHLPPGADYAFVGAVNAVLDVADALGWERFALLGHSMGAGIASLVAAACPQRIERFVAIEALGALAEAPERTVARLRDAVAACARCARKPLRVFPDIDTAVARADAGQRIGRTARRGCWSSAACAGSTAATPGAATRA